MQPKIQQDLTDYRKAMHEKINGNTQLRAPVKNNRLKRCQHKWSVLGQPYAALVSRCSVASTITTKVARDWDIGNIPKKRDEVEERPSCKVVSTTSSTTTLSPVVSRSETQ